MLRFRHQFLPHFEWLLVFIFEIFSARIFRCLLRHHFISLWSKTVTKGRRNAPAGKDFWHLGAIPKRSKNKSAIQPRLFMDFGTICHTLGIGLGTIFVTILHDIGMNVGIFFNFLHNDATRCAFLADTRTQAQYRKSLPRKSAIMADPLAQLLHVRN